MKLFRKPRQDEKRRQPSHHHRSSDPRVVRSKEQQYQEHSRHKRQYQPQHPMAPNQYEYVRREHGFDFMPPSQYVPSRSLSEDTDDASVDPPIKIQVPGSDLSLSIVRSIDPHVDTRHKTPVVRGKPVRTRSSSRKKDRMESSHRQVVLPAGSPQHRVPRQERGGDHGKSKQYKSRQQRDDSSYYQRETTQIKARTRSEPTNYKDSSSAVGRHSPREMAPPASRRGHSPDPPIVRYHEHEARSVQHDRRGTRHDRRSYGEEYYQEDDGGYGSPPSIPKVPTAFSYQSEDSLENPQATFPRYGLSDEEKGYLQITTAKGTKGREKGPTHLGHRDGSSRRHDNVSRGVDLDALSTPTFDKKTIRRESDSVTGRIIIAPPIDTHHSRRRSRDVRDPIEVFEPPLGLEQRRHDESDEFDVELSIGSYPDEVYYENPVMEQGYHGGHKRHQSTGRNRGDQKVKDRKKKSKGLLSRIRDTVLKEKEKGAKRVVERAGDQDLREKGSLFENLVGSIDSDTSSDRQYPHDARSTRAPLPRDDNRYYEQPTRMPARHVAPPPRTRSHRDSFDRRQGRPVDYVYDEAPEIHQVQSSGKPFQTLRATTPTLRANPDNRQRYGGMNAATPKLYRSQVQDMGTSGHQRNHQHSPFLNYDATQGSSHYPRRMRFHGC